MKHVLSYLGQNAERRFSSIKTDVLDQVPVIKWVEHRARQRRPPPINQAKVAKTFGFSDIFEAQQTNEAYIVSLMQNAEPNIGKLMKQRMLDRFKILKVDFHRKNRGFLSKCQSSRGYVIEPGSGKLHP